MGIFNKEHWKLIGMKQLEFMLKITVVFKNQLVSNLLLQLIFKQIYSNRSDDTSNGWCHLLESELCFACQHDLQKYFKQ